MHKLAHSRSCLFFCYLLLLWKRNNKTSVEKKTSTTLKPKKNFSVCCPQGLHFLGWWEKRWTDRNSGTLLSCLTAPHFHIVVSAICPFKLRFFFPYTHVDPVWPNLILMTQILFLGRGLLGWFSSSIYLSPRVMQHTNLHNFFNPDRQKGRDMNSLTWDHLEVSYTHFQVPAQLAAAPTESSSSHLFLLSTPGTNRWCGSLEMQACVEELGSPNLACLLSWDLVKPTYLPPAYLRRRLLHPHHECSRLLLPTNTRRFSSIIILKIIFPWNVCANKIFPYK